MFGVPIVRTMVFRGFIGGPHIHRKYQLRAGSEPWGYIALRDQGLGLGFSELGGPFVGSP